LHYGIEVLIEVVFTGHNVAKRWEENTTKQVAKEGKKKVPDKGISRIQGPIRFFF
jgi:hypothetical protein